MGLDVKITVLWDVMCVFWWRYQ